MNIGPIPCYSLSLILIITLLSCVSSLIQAGSRRRFAAATSSVFLDNRRTHTFGTSLFSTTSAMVETPPTPRREDDRVVYAGSAPEGWDPKIPRQSNDSEEPMMNPPVAIPDPYGWLRDDKRENKEVLDHLHAENAYSKAVTKHLEVSIL